MTNQDTIAHLQDRRTRVEVLIGIQTHQDAIDLLRAELFYIDAQIHYRTKHGGLADIVLSVFSH